jgi:hypothetical protein
LISDVADVRQHLLAEQFERFHQLVRRVGWEDPQGLIAKQIWPSFRRSDPQ